MRALGGWIALTPELSAKLLMGRHVWDLAQQCDAFGQRLPELRSRAHVSEAANPAVAAFMDSLEDAEGPDQPVDRLVGVYGVLKPHLLATYRDHLARANPVYEPPTRRILARCIDDEERHIAAGETILKYLAAGPRVSERASARRRHLEGLLAVAGGVTGDGLPTRDAPDVARRQIDLSDDAREFIRLEKATGTWPVPEDLDEAQRSFAAALVAGDVAALARWLVPGLGLKTVAVYSEADRGAPHVRDADEAVEIGAAPARESYLNVPRILEAARRARADAIHPGYGFLSESWRFAEAVQQAGMVFIGPRPDAIRKMGDKIEARRLMSAAGVSVLPGSFDAVGDVTRAEAVAREVGYPVILKAAAGGGGIGMARVDKPADLGTAFAAATRRAQAAFGTADLYVERYVERPRHVEVQVFGDDAGTVVHMHERECSIQRRHQKLVEESPAPGLPAVTKDGVTAAAVRGARAIGYSNAGTMEFLVDERGGFYFLEMNARLQVEHPVTEEVTGLDLVVAQLRAAAGEPLPWRQGEIVQRPPATE